MNIHLAFEFLSAPLWLLTLLQLVTLTLHLLAMNFLVGGVIAVLWGKFTGRFEHPVVQRFIRLSPSMMAATISLGVAPLLFVQLVYGRMFYSAPVISAWYWLAILPTLVLAYYSLYAAAYGNSPQPEPQAQASAPVRKMSGTRTAQLLSVALLALVFISLVYSATFALAEQPDVEGQLYAKVQSGLALNPMLGAWILRWLHMILGAVTVGGFFVAYLGQAGQARQGEQDQEGQAGQTDTEVANKAAAAAAADEAFAVGKRFFLWGLIGNTVVGLAYVGSLGPRMHSFMKSPAIWTLMVAVLLALAATHFVFQRQLRIAGLLLVLSVAGMVLTRHFLRLLRLRGIYEPSTLPVQANWPLVGLFLLSFGLMLGLLFYMARLYRPALAKK